MFNISARRYSILATRVHFSRNIFNFMSCFYKYKIKKTNRKRLTDVLTEDKSFAIRLYSTALDLTTSVESDKS